MKDKTYKKIIVVLYLISLAILLYCIKIRLTPHISLKTDARLFLLLIVCLLIYINGYILVKKLNYSKKILKINLIIYFLIYTVIIFTLTLFDEIYGRNGIILIKWNRKLLKTYMNYSFNIIPFKTIKLFIYGYTKGIVSFKNFSNNIIGNLCAFMPYGLFLPLIFKKINKYYKFLIVMVLIVLCIEFLQFITASGSCDIDDLILNVFGCSIIYFITNIKIIKKYIRKIFLYE